MNFARNHQRGAIVPFLLLVLLGIGIFVGMQLIGKTQIFKPKAFGSQTIYFTGPNVSKNKDDQFVTSDYKVEVVLHSPFGPSLPKPIPYPTSTPPPLSDCGGIANIQCPKGFSCVYNSKDKYPDQSGVCLPIPVPPPSPTTSLACGGFTNLSCPKGFECVNLPEDGKNNYPDQGGICVPSKLGYPIPPKSSCLDNPCPTGFACLSVNNQSFCVNSTINTDAPNKSPLEYVQKIAQSQTQRNALDSQSSEAVIDSNLSTPSDISVKCRINPGYEPTIDKLDVNWDVSANASEVEVYLDDVSKTGWSGNCDKTYPGDACQKVAPSQKSAELTIKEGELYNVWVEYKDNNGRLSKPSKKFPISCNPKPPVTISTVAFRLAENEEELNYTSFRPYIGNFNSSTSNDGTIIVPYYFKDLTPGTKTVWVQFLSNDGKVSGADSATIILQRSEVTPPPSACSRPVTCPFPTTLPGQNCTWNNNDNDPCSCPNIVCTSTSTPSPSFPPPVLNPSSNPIPKVACTGSRGAAILAAFARGESANDLPNLYVVYGCLTRAQAEVANSEAAAYYQQYGVSVTEGQINDMIGAIEAGRGPDRSHWRQPAP